jgi:hypothetical protein
LYQAVVDFSKHKKTHYKISLKSKVQQKKNSDLKVKIGQKQSVPGQGRPGLFGCS